MRNLEAVQQGLIIVRDALTPLVERVPVSYTHLDVYKRQVLDHTLHNGLMPLADAPSGSGRNHQSIPHRNQRLDIQGCGHLATYGREPASLDKVADIVHHGGQHHPGLDPLQFQKNFRRRKPLIPQGYRNTHPVSYTHLDVYKRQDGLLP